MVRTYKEGKRDKKKKQNIKTSAKNREKRTFGSVLRWVTILAFKIVQAITYLTSAETRYNLGDLYTRYELPRMRPG